MVGQLQPCRGEAAYGVRELVPAFWPTPHANTPCSRIPDLPTPICDLRHLVSSCSKSYSSLYFPLFPLLPPVHSFLRLRVGVNRDSTQEPAKHIRARTPSPVCRPFIRGGILNGPTRLRFELVRARASSIQARSASKWIRRFRVPRFRSLTDLTDPLACASSSYALARLPYKHAAPASGSGVSVLALPRRSRLWSAGTCSRFLAYTACKHPLLAHPRSPNSDLRSPTPCVATAHLPGIRQS